MSSPPVTSDCPTSDGEVAGLAASRARAAGALAGSAAARASSEAVLLKADMEAVYYAWLAWVIDMTSVRVLRGAMCGVWVGPPSLSTRAARVLTPAPRLPKRPHAKKKH